MTTASPIRKAFGPLEFSLAVAALAAWAVARPYAGLVHDARLYALQALGRLHPESLGQDVFLRYGSQDAFSIFGGIYAAFVALLGPEEAARWLTLAGQLWWFSAAGWIAVRMLGRAKGLLALAILAGLPGHYGAWEVFRYAEPFLTARLFAEATVLTGLAFLISGQRVASLAAMALSTFIHPLMGVAGLLFWMACSLPRRLLWLLPVAVMAGTAAVIALAHMRPVFPLQVFDGEWLEYARLRSPFLFLADWSADSFRLALLPLLALWALPSGEGPSRESRIYLAGILVGVLGLGVTLAGADLAHVVLIVQGQAWRWTWIPAVLVVLAAVRHAPGHWRGGAVGRAGLLLFLTAWILSGWPAVSIAVVGALLLRYGQAFPRRVQRVTFLLAVSVAIAGLGAAVSSLFLGPSALRQPQESGLSGSMMQALAAGGVLITLLVTVVYWAGSKPRFRVTGLALAGCLALVSLPILAPRLAADQFMAADPGMVDSWKSIIPTDAEVFWPERPTACWVLLERRSFVSSVQTSGILFSPEAFNEILDRLDEVSAILPRAFALRAATEGALWAPTEQTVVQTCQSRALDYVVTEKALDLPETAPPIRFRDEREDKTHEAHLYRCEDFRTPAIPSDP